MANITVHLKSNNGSLSQDEFEVWDRICDVPLGTWTLNGGQSVDISICAEGSGFGSVKIRNPNLNNDWVGTDFIKEGETVTR